MGGVDSIVGEQLDNSIFGRFNKGWLDSGMSEGNFELLV